MKRLFKLIFLRGVIFGFCLYGFIISSQGLYRSYQTKPQVRFKATPTLRADIYQMKSDALNEEYAKLWNTDI